MDRAFLAYYEDELAHVRELGAEFAALHPTVARNLQLDAVPCPDPYVERLLEGVAFLAARTRLKVDAESTRYVEAVIDALCPELLAPGPAVAMALLRPGPQVATMLGGHRVPRGARLLAAFREGMATRMTFTTAQDVTLWPLRVARAEYLAGAGALRAAGLGGEGAEAALRLVLAREGAGPLSDLALDRLDLYLGAGARGGALWDALLGSGTAVRARPEGAGPWREAAPPGMAGIGDDEALLPPVRGALGGARLLREYFLAPERFHYLRLDGLLPAVRACAGGALEVAVLLSRPRPVLSDVSAADLAPFVAPVVNLFERECDAVELDPRRSAHPVHADRARPRDFEVYALVRVEDAEGDAALEPLHGLARRPGAALYATHRRPRRPTEDEVRRGQMRTTYGGDDLYVTVANAGAMRRLDVRALCTNRDLPLLDDAPRLLVETGDPVAEVALLAPLRRPVPAGHGRPPRPGARDGADDGVAWRLVAQLALNHLSLAEAGRDAEALRALLAVHADRGDPGLARHAEAIRALGSRRVVERLALPGPLCFGHGIEITLDVDEGPLAGGSALLLTALLGRLFARGAGINGFVRTRTRLNAAREEVAWPTTPGLRPPI